jgi:hypothetical protein
MNVSMRFLMLSFQYYVTRKIEKRQKDRKVEIQKNRKTGRPDTRAEKHLEIFILRPLHYTFASTPVQLLMLSLRLPPSLSA